MSFDGHTRPRGDSNQSLIILHSNLSNALVIDSNNFDQNLSLRKRANNLLRRKVPGSTLIYKKPKAKIHLGLFKNISFLQRNVAVSRQYIYVVKGN